MAHPPSRPVIPDSTVPGTRAWAEAMIGNARKYAGFAEGDVRPLVERYEALCEHRVWETWFVDEPRTLERFCREVLGYEDEFLETMSAGVAVLDREGHSGPVSVEAALHAVRAQARARAAKGAAVTAADEVPLPGIGRPVKSNNIRLNPYVAGTSASYLRRRLKQDYPELYQRVLLPEGDPQRLSAHKAAIEAGIRHRNISVPITQPDTTARSLLKHMSPEDIGRLIELLMAGNVRQ